LYIKYNKRHRKITKKGTFFQKNALILTLYKATRRTEKAALGNIPYTQEVQSNQWQQI
jgi:hypothetical protein